MATLTIGDLDDDLVRRLHIRAAANGRSAEEEHRDILRVALIGDYRQPINRQEIAARLAEFRERLAGRGGPSVLELLEESRNERMEALTRGFEGR
jgi:plasmid stability protein